MSKPHRKICVEFPDDLLSVFRVACHARAESMSAVLRKLAINYIQESSGLSLNKLSKKYIDDFLGELPEQSDK